MLEIVFLEQLLLLLRAAPLHALLLPVILYLVVELGCELKGLLQQR